MNRTKYSVTSRLSIIADKFDRANADLYEISEAWGYLLENYTGKPLENLNELLENERDMEELFEIMGIDK